MFRLTKNDFALPYKGYVKKSYRLKNGWCAVILVNRVAILINPITNQHVIAGAVKKVVEADDGKFMFIRKDKTKAVFNSKGKMLADYNVHSNLLRNGWFTRENENEVTLFDADGQAICSKITKAEVFSDGRYYISVSSGGNAAKVGFFEADGSRIHFTNDCGFKRVSSLFFIADGSLYDLTGECLIEANQGNNFNRILVRFIGALPFGKH